MEVENVDVDGGASDDDAVEALWNSRDGRLHTICTIMALHAYVDEASMADGDGDIDDAVPLRLRTRALGDPEEEEDGVGGE